MSIIVKEDWNKTWIVDLNSRVIIDKFGKFLSIICEKKKKIKFISLYAPQTIKTSQKLIGSFTQNHDIQL